MKRFQATLIYQAILIYYICLSILPCTAQTTEDQSTSTDDQTNNHSNMTATQLIKLIKVIDPNATKQGNGWQFKLENTPLICIYDEKADRMRLLSPIKEAKDLSKSDLIRLMQANFHSALDARYALANDILWSIYIHPLSNLTEQELFMAVGEVVNIVLSHGSTYSSGLFIFNGGDSGEIQRRKLIDKLKELQKRQKV